MNTQRNAAVRELILAGKTAIEIQKKGHLATAVKRERARMKRDPQILFNAEANTFSKK